MNKYVLVRNDGIRQDFMGDSIRIDGFKMVSVLRTIGFVDAIVGVIHLGPGDSISKEE